MNKQLAGIAAAAALFTGIPQSHALLQIAGNIGGTAFFCADGQACDINPLPHVLQLANQTINGVQINTSIQSSEINATQNILNTSSTSLINVSGASRTITFTVGDTDFLGPVSTFSTAGAGTWQNAGGSTITLGWFNDPANTQGANTAGNTPGTQIDTFADVANGAADSFAHNGSGPISDPALFSMTLNATGTLAAGGANCVTSGPNIGDGCPALINRGQTEIKDRVAVPEPASLALLGSALAGLGLVYRRRRFSA